MAGDAATGIDLGSIDFELLSRRIVEAARLAAAAHLYESVRHATHPAGGASDDTNGQRIGIGGAGPFVLNRRGGNATDGDHPAPPPAAADRSRRPSIFFPDAGHHAPDDRRAGPR